jgi:uncharacterized protein YjbI with pentapeptide repeats
VPWSFKRPSIPVKYQPWLKENQWWIQLVVLALVATVMVIAFKRGDWSDWVDFKGKTVWNWLELLGVPLALAALGYVLQQQQQKRAESLSREQREIAADEAKEEILQVYFDRLSTLLVDKNILAIATKVRRAPEEEQSETAIAPTSEERELLGAAIDVIRARTLSILRRFEGDGARKSSVLRFLIEAEVISKAKLSLRGADLRGADLSRAVLINADLSRADLSRADLSYAGLIGAKLIGAKLSGADLRGTDLWEAKLSGADLRDADLFCADLRGAVLWEAKLSGAKLMSAKFISADLSYADLSRAKLINADLSRAKLIGAKLIGADLIGAKLIGADLRGAVLRGTDLWEADLSGADLSGVDLSGVDLSGADLSGADLSGADLSGANLSGADLSGANLSTANLNDVKWDKETKWPDSTEGVMAQNIPEELKQQLGITGKAE